MDHEWVPVGGHGTVYSFVIVHQPLRGWEDEVPYVVVIIELDEGPHILSNVVGVAPDRVDIGLSVQVIFEQATKEIALPKFKPTGE